MSEARYFAADAADTSERQRLGLLEQLLDPLTIRRLEALGVAAGWRCLTVGAGRGSIPCVGLRNVWVPRDRWSRLIATSAFSVS